MGFHLIKKAYAVDKDRTTATEQTVLVALAFYANDKTHVCYPKQETLSGATHLHRTTVSQALNSLRAKGLLEWRSGGFRNKRGKYGQPLANDYILRLPEPDKKADSCVAEDNTAVSPRATRQCSGGQHGSVAEDNTAVLPRTTPTRIYSTAKSTPIPNRDVSESGFNEALRKLGVAEEFKAGYERRKEKAIIEMSPVLKALDICGLTRDSESYKDNYRAFISAMLKLGYDESWEILHTFESEMRAGEMQNVRNLPALLMSRLKKR